MKFLFLVLFTSLLSLTAYAGPFQDLLAQFASAKAPASIETMNQVYFGQCFSRSSLNPIPVVFVGIIDPKYDGYENLKFTTEELSYTPELGTDKKAFQEYYRGMFDQEEYAQGQAFTKNDTIAIEESSSGSDKIFWVKQDGDNLILKLQGFNGYIYWMCQYPTQPVR